MIYWLVHIEFALATRTTVLMLTQIGIRGRRKQYVHCFWPAMSYWISNLDMCIGYPLPSSMCNILWWRDESYSLGNGGIWHQWATIGWSYEGYWSTATMLLWGWYNMIRRCIRACVLCQSPWQAYCSGTCPLFSRCGNTNANIYWFDC
jgi:hypothetical protein